MLDFYPVSMQLVAQEDFIAFNCHENFGFYVAPVSLVVSV
jgi:hypothetical protein